MPYFFCVGGLVSNLDSAFHERSAADVQQCWDYDTSENQPIFDAINMKTSFQLPLFCSQADALENWFCVHR